MNTITINNIKGLKELTFQIPQTKGAYLLTGLNGCGETTLLVALARLYDNRAFSKYLRVGGATGLDAVRNGRFKYLIDGEEVAYTHKERRWDPIPRSKSKLLADKPMFTRVIYIGTEGSRVYMQEPLHAERLVYNDVSDNIKNTLNSVLDTHKFDNLKYITVDMRGRRRIPHRENKLYAIQVPGKSAYTERNFSLGERFMLNMMDIMDGIPTGSLLLIDAIELALHPSAQIKFYDYLVSFAEENDIVVIISTHSSSLIKHSKNTFYLEVENGIVSVLDDCYPAYILKDISPWEDRQPDYLFFVEDVQAHRYLSNLLKEYKNRDQVKADISIMPVAGQKQTIQYMINNVGVGPYTLRNMQCFPDADVFDDYQQNLANYANLKESTRAYTDMITTNSANITYLDITPEVGVWFELHANTDFFEDALNERKGGVIPTPVSTIVALVDAEEAGKNIGNPRKKAKFDMLNFRDKIIADVPMTEDEFWSLIWQSYTHFKMSDANFYNEWKIKFDTILNR